ncbi:phenylacetate--CoA ligase family protein [Candidatus Njordibacter sp. Uisw_002]|uniref:phenylacetate--CoA ligase family protein n=1 Tax=Candidatus Njordibacter sp. Uisw_002 TaxID=3230971 RepID=UPI003D3A2F6A
MMTDFYNNLETREPGQRQIEQIQAVAAQVAHAKATCPGWAGILHAVVASDITSTQAIAKLPITRKSSLVELQKNNMPFGGLVSSKAAPLAYVFSSPGPINEPGFEVPDHWHFARALYAGGLRKGDLVHNTFSYHFTPAGAMFDSALKALGCTVVAAGVGNSEMQAQSIAALKPKAYVGTPSFLKILLEKADNLNLNVSSLTHAVVGGEPFFPAQQDFFKARGLNVLQGYATADLGSIAYETPARQGMVIDEDVYVEIVRPGTGDLVADGEVGEVVVTNFNKHYPLIRFATGDMSAILVGQSPCGRTNRRIKGWMGRADQAAKVRGMFVRPEQVADLVAKHEALVKVRLQVKQINGQDSLQVLCEVKNTLSETTQLITEGVRSVLHLRGEVVLHAIGSLPNDGIVIDDQRER